MRLAAAAAIACILGVAAFTQEKPKPVADLYNLGPLGGKAAILRTELPAGAKSTLRVESIIADAAGAKAGLKVGDILYGVASASFGENAYLELGAAIDAAECGEDATLSLRVKRGAELIDVRVKLAPPAKSANAGEPPPPAFRDKLVDDALAWLARQQQADGSWSCNLSVENGLVVQTSLAGLCFLAAGDTPEKGKYAQVLLKAAQFVLENVGEQKQYKRLGGKNNDQTHWSLGYGGIFLAHVQHATDAKWLAKSPLREIKKKLGWIKTRIERGMEPSGGFGHGPGGPNALGYVEFECMSNLLLAALGCIKQCGIEPDAKALAKMLAYTRECTDDNGAVAYSATPPHNLIRSPARSAALANALAALGLHEDPLYAKVMKCAQDNVAHAFAGHSTPTMHPLAFAMAARRQGANSCAAYWKANRVEMTILRNPAGSFSYRPTPETALLGINIDRDMTDVWTTSHWTLILMLEKGALPLWLGEKK